MLYLYAIFLIYLFIAVDQIIPGLHHTFFERTETSFGLNDEINFIGSIGYTF